MKSDNGTVIPFLVLKTV